MSNHSINPNRKSVNLSRNQYEFAHRYIRTNHLTSLEEVAADLGWMQTSVFTAAWISQTKEFNVQSRFQWLIKKAADANSKYDSAVKEHGPNFIHATKLKPNADLWTSVLLHFAIEHAAELNQAVL